MSLDLQDVSETLWIPLFGKAIESQRDDALLNDLRAVEIARQACSINPKLTSWWKALSKESQALMVWRFHALDSIVSQFIDANKNPLIVNLGAGLCTRFDRMNNESLHWIEIDLPPVKKAWSLFNSEKENHQYWTDDIFQVNWLKKIASIENREILFIAEGLFMYFSKEQVKSILMNIQSFLPGAEIAFEAYSKFVLMRPHPDVKRTSAKRFDQPWGIRKGIEFERWNDGITHIKDDYFLTHPIARKRLPIHHLMGSKLPSIAKAGKIVHLKLGKFFS